MRPGYPPLYKPLGGHANSVRFRPVVLSDAEGLLNAWRDPVHNVKEQVIPTVWRDSSGSGPVRGAAPLENGRQRRTFPVGPVLFPPDAWAMLSDSAR